MNRDDGFFTPWPLVAPVHSVETAGLAVVVVTAYGVARCAEVDITARISVFILAGWLRYVGVDLLWDF
jgi:hypothetical protein